jgi:phage terminase large subunit GpA-like protein
MTGPATKTQELLSECWELWRPPPRTSVSEWVSKNVMLPESAAASGQFCDVSRTPWAVEPLDAVADRRVRRIVLMWGVQLAKTQLTLNAAAWRIRHDPVPILYCQPAIEDCEEFSKERVGPMLEDSPALAKLIVPDKSRSSSSTIKLKTFRGGWFGLVGMNAPRGMRRRSAGMVICDEVEEYPVNVGGGKNGPKQGDPIAIIEKRMRTFAKRNPKMFVLSTPTVKGESVIEREYLASTQERWCIPCPSCGEYQPYEFNRLIFPRNESGERVSNSEKLSPDEIQALIKLTYHQRGYRATQTAELLERLNVAAPEMACIKCGCLHSEWEWKAGKGQWIAQRPERFTRNNITRGFHMNSMASYSVSWQELQEHFYKAIEEGPESIQTFVNTELAELWESAGERLDEDKLKERRHYYDCDVPDGVVWITAGVDVQKDRLEAEIVGWGVGEQSWGIRYVVLPGDTQLTAVWHDLDELITRTFVREDGAVLPISCVAVDSQYATSAVHAFTKPRTSRYVFAIRGVGGPGLPLVNKVTLQGKRKDVYVFPVGTDAAKDLISSNLSIDIEGPGYCHFPREAAMSDGQPRGYDEAYFRGLLSEKRVKRRSLGREWHVWEKPKASARNEPLDTRVYAYAALRITNPPLARLAESKGRTPVLTNAAQRPKRRRGVVSKGIQ